MKCYGGSGESLLATSLTILLCYILLTQVVEGNVRCYVCSWQNPSQTYGSTNMTDTCSHYNFDPTLTVTIECDVGCEAVAIRKSKNENIVNFYKNCIPESKKKSQVEDKCTTTEDKVQYITTCECTSDLCNVGVRMSDRVTGIYLYILSFTYIFLGFLATRQTIIQ